MAFVVARPGGRWEARESVTTPKGPRARTLATFKVLTDDVTRRAVGRATRPTSAEQIADAARRAGAPVAGTGADAAAAELLRLIDHGVPLSERLRRLLSDRLGADDPASDGSDLPAAARAAAPWSGATPTERGETLLDLLSVVDRLPAPRRGPERRFPRLDSTAGTA